MFISVEFGYHQKKLFNIDCQTASLIDAINDGCYAEMNTFLKKRIDFFNKEINQWKKKEASLLKKLEKLEPKVEEEPILDSGTKTKGAKSKPNHGGRTNVTVRTKPEHPSKRKPGAGGKKGKKEDKKEDNKEEEELLRQQQEEARKKEEDDKKKAEDAAAAAKNKGKKDKNAVEEEDKKEETEEEKKEREKQEVNKGLEEVRGSIKKMDDKIEQIKKTIETLTTEVDADKVLDLQDKSGDRKYSKTKGDLYANTFLTEKMTYTFGKVVQEEGGDEEFKSIAIDGACIRSLEEDANYDEDAVLANDPKKGAKGKKK